MADHCVGTRIGHSSTCRVAKIASQSTSGSRRGVCEGRSTRRYIGQTIVIPSITLSIIRCAAVMYVAIDG